MSVDFNTINGKFSQMASQFQSPVHWLEQQTKSKMSFKQKLKVCLVKWENLKTPMKH